MTKVEERVEEILESVMALDVDTDGEWLEAFNAARDELVTMVFAALGDTVTHTAWGRAKRAIGGEPDGVKSVSEWNKFSEDKEGFIAP